MTLKSIKIKIERRHETVDGCERNWSIATDSHALEALQGCTPSEAKKTAVLTGLRELYTLAVQEGFADEAAAQMTTLRAREEAPKEGEE